MWNCHAQVNYQRVRWQRCAVCEKANRAHHLQHARFGFNATISQLLTVPPYVVGSTYPRTFPSLSRLLCYSSAYSLHCL